MLDALRILGQRWRAGGQLAKRAIEKAKRAGDENQDVVRLSCEGDFAYLRVGRNLLTQLLRLSNMLIDENKYNTLFITKFKANQNEFKSEFKRVKDYYGATEEIKLEFYKASFKTLITQFKKELPKDENYGYIITTLYNYFIKALKEDSVDTSSYAKELEAFKAMELPKAVIQQNVVNNYIPQYKAYNLNTKYGRRKAKEQALRNYENGTTEYRQEIDNIKSVVWFIIIVLIIIGFIIKAALTSK